MLRATLPKRRRTQGGCSVLNWYYIKNFFSSPLPQRCCWPRHHQQRYCHRRAWFHNDHLVPVLYSRPGHVLRARCPSTVRASVCTRPRKGAQYLHDHSCCGRSDDGAHPFMGPPLSENSRVTDLRHHRTPASPSWRPPGWSSPSRATACSRSRAGSGASLLRDSRRTR